MANTYPASGFACIDGVYSDVRVSGYPGGNDGVLFMCIASNDYQAIRGYDGNLSTIHFFGTNWANCTLGNSVGSINIEGRCGVTFGAWNTPQMVIRKSDGNVGIGTSSPTEGLVVATGAFRVTSQALDFSAGTRGISIDTTAGNVGRIYTVTGTGTATDLTFGTNNSERLRITTSGNVGIGTTSPSSKLDVSGADGRIQSRVDSSDGSTINIRPNAGKCGWISYTEDAVADRWGIGVKNGDAKLYFASGNVGSGGGTTRMVLDGSGNVGIGTTSPATNLHICDANALGRDDMIRLTQGNINNHAYIRSERCNGAMILMGATRNSFDGCIASDSGIFWSFCNNPIIIGTCNRERVRFASNGSVGIGITSPSYQLHVNGTFYAAGSSQDYKEGICQYNTDSCLFMCLKPKAYQYKEEWKHLGKDLKSGTQIGLIAEEVAESHPELAVLVNEEDNQVVRNVDYEKLSIILLAEVQKLRQEVDQLKQK